MERVDVIGRKVKIGSIVLGVVPGSDTVWIEQNGQGGPFPLEEVERLLERYYRENF